MSGARPLLVVTLPGRGVRVASEQLREAARSGADAAEVRIDRWEPAERDRAAELFPSPIPLVATLRSRREGGEGPDDATEREGTLRRLASLPFRWIDVELETDRPWKDRWPSGEPVGRIVSCHLAAPAADAWSARWTELTRTDGIGKLVFPASVPFTLRGILPEVLARPDARVIVHTTGPSGPILRALSARLGFPMVFSALPERTGTPPVEPSQIPVDRLRRFLQAPEPRPLFAVVGRPIGHSRSPAVHSAWMESAGRTGLYVALEFADDAEFLDSLPLLASCGFRGLNVTRPFKAAAFEAADEAATSAEACRAANCLAFEEGEVVAENTDLAAVLRRLEELRDDGRWDGHHLTVVGAGGAARATLAASRELGADAAVVARRADEARALAQEFGARTAPGEPAPGTLVVHATSAGRTGSGALEVPLGPLLARGCHLLDWVYRADDPAVRDAARAAGATYEDGWRLFVYQAAASYSIWWGDAPDEAVVERTIAEGACGG